MTDLLDALSAIPVPDIIQPLDYETALAVWKARFVQQAAGLGLAYDVEGLATDPAVIVGETAVYQELLLRALGNDIARQGYLYFAFGTGVDQLALFYDVIRLPGEADARLKERVILAIQGRSTGGPEARYRFIALSASLRVAEAKVYVVGDDPTIRVALIAADNNGVADPGLIAIVSAALNAETVKLVNDTIVVEAAVILVRPVTAALTLHPNTADSLLTTLAAQLPVQWAAEGGIGRDLTIDWIKAKLMVAGVRSVAVTVPASDDVMLPYQAVRIGTVTLTVAGRDF
jgi:phage-related baseplate assembly protein